MMNVNTESRSEAYAAAGVDITAGYKAVELMKKHIARTMTSGVCSDVGGFGGLYELDLEGITKPVLVSGTDGVGVLVGNECCYQKSRFCVRSKSRDILNHVLFRRCRPPNVRIPHENRDSGRFELEDFL